MRASRKCSVNPAESKRHTGMLKGCAARYKLGAARLVVGDVQNTQAHAIPGHPLPVAEIVVACAARARSET